ncbi:MAG: hypothetical protein ACRDS1_05210 [Pseudonocardiaceae bacterium]
MGVVERWKYPAPEHELPRECRHLGEKLDRGAVANGIGAVTEHGQGRGRVEPDHRH